MNTEEIKKIVAQHFDYATPGTGQYLHGDWFTPKHKDALQYVLEKLMEPVEDSRGTIEVLRRKLGNVRDEVTDQEAEDALEEAA